MKAFDISRCPPVIFEFAQDKLLEAWAPAQPPRRSVAKLLKGWIDPLYETKRKKPREPIAYACVRWFAEIDQDSRDVAGEFIAAWRISRFGDVSGPFVQPPENADHVPGPYTAITELKMNFAFGPGECALELIWPSGEVERLRCRCERFDCPRLGDVVGKIKYDRVKPNKHAPHFPSRYRPAK